MASINKLSIRGVRSFSPTDEEQVIEFCFPVTIILGANGCGKTTIIESLKYAMTGSLPPGNKSGQAFVNDPKSCGQSNVKACIKLRFTNRAGHSMVVIRSMEVTQKKTTLSFKALDGILRTQDQNTGERVSMSHKCTELDRQIPALMGVSKAILEHVVFCHQEDSSWPLQEGAVLKKRFDEIFDSTRYVKALEAIRKTKLEYASIAKDKKAELTGLESHKYAASGFRKEMEDCTDKLDTLKVEYDGFKEETEKEVKIQEDLQKKLNEIQEAQQKINELELQADKARSLAEMHKSHLDTDYTTSKSIQELKTILREFNTNKGKYQEEYENLENVILDKKESISNMQYKMQEYREKRGILSSQLANLENLVTKRWNVIQEISKKYDIMLPDEVGTQPNATFCVHDNIQSFLTSLDEYQTTLQTTLSNKQKERQEIEDKLQFEIGKLDSEKMTIETDHKRLQTKMADAKRELKTINNSVAGGTNESFYGSSINTYATAYSTKVTKKDVEDARKEIDEASKYFQKVSTDPKLQTIPKDIKKYEEKSKQIQQEIDEDRETLTYLRDNAEQQANITSLENDITKEINNLKDVPNQNEYLWKKFSDLLPERMEFNYLQDMSNRINILLMDNKKQLDLLQKDHSAKENEISVKKTLLNTLQSDRLSMLAQINELDADENRGIKKILRVIQRVRKKAIEKNEEPEIAENHNPEELLEYLDDVLNEINSSDISPASVKEVMKRILKKAKQVNEQGTLEAYSCPCCDRKMRNEDYNVFKDKVKSLIQEIGQNDEQAQIENDKKQYERWRKIVYDSMDDFKTFMRLQDEVEKKEELIAKDQADIKTLSQELDALKPKLEDYQSKASDIQVLSQDCFRMCNDAQRISQKQQELKVLQGRICEPTNNTGGRDLRQVEEDLQTRSETKDNIMSKREKLNKDLMHLNQKVLNAQREVEEKQKIYKEREAKYEKDQEMNRRRAELNDMLESYYEEEKNLTQKISPLDCQLVSKKNERERMRREFKQELDELNKSYNDFNSDKFLIQNLNTQIEQSEKSCNRDDLDKLEGKIEHMDHKINEQTKEIDDLEPQLETIKQKFNEEKKYEKTLQGNIEVLQEMEDLMVLEEKLGIQKKEYEMKHSSSANFQEQYDNSLRRKRKQEDAMARCEGRVLSLKEQVRNLRHKLKTPEYKDIDERTRVKMIEHETTNIAIQDLESYYTALDKALLQYHRLKIEDINKIIRELWSLTYKGQDISNIEIVSGQESGSRAARSYNYRVVMTKGGMTKMDMRGRCSAGQRVLASIVIRLALAETFCLNCGVMTLDEPTTNLDYENKRGLAIALAQIITARSSQQNFQLVTITHDEDFVAMMKNELSSQTSFDMPERYFQVSREEANDGKHYSKINAVDWDSI